MTDIIHTKIFNMSDGDDAPFLELMDRYNLKKYSVFWHNFSLQMVFAGKKFISFESILLISHVTTFATLIFMKNGV